MIRVDGNIRQWSENMTIAQLLEQLEDVKFCSVVRINGKLISSPKFKTTIIPDKAVIQLLPLVAGG